MRAHKLLDYVVIVVDNTTSFFKKTTLTTLSLGNVRRAIVRAFRRDKNTSQRDEVILLILSSRSLCCYERNVVGLSC